MKRIINSQDIINRICNYRYVSFDLFDTLIKRDVQCPSDVFLLVEDDNYQGFKEARIEAEKKARLDKEGKEITLDDIYFRIEKKYADCKEKELELESNICTVNHSLKIVYDYCLQNRIKIIIITDIYLGKEVIKTILSNCGYICYDYLFISSEEGCMKADGSLFKLVFNRIGIDAKDLVHVGDNEKSDYEIPMKSGINSVLIDRKITNLQYAKYTGDVYRDYWGSFTNNRLTENNHFFRTGYECFGPLLYGFVRWIIRKLENENIRRVFFLSRDGHIIKKAFDEMYKGPIKSDYLYVSRKALLVPALKLYKNVDDFRSKYHFPYSFTAQKLCRIMGCEVQEVINKIIEETKTVDYLFYRDSIARDTHFDQVYYHTRNVLADNIDEQFYLFGQYLREMKFEGRVAIVDIGWHGNMQKNLEALVASYNIDCDILGYYVAMTPSENLKKCNNMQGFLFDSFHNQELMNKEQLFNAPFELLFTGDHGTVLGYNLGNPVTAKMDCFEIEDKDSLDLIRNYQDGALGFCRDANKEAIYKELPIEYISDVLFSQFLAPILVDAQKWGNIIHEDNGRKKLVTFKSRRRYFFHPKEILTDYHNSTWKVGFIKLLINKKGFYDGIVLAINLIGKIIRGR